MKMNSSRTGEGAKFGVTACEMGAEVDPDAVRDALEKRILAEELARAEVSDVRLFAVAAAFSLVEGRRVGLHLNYANVILRIDEDGLAHQEGTLRVGDRIVAVNTMPADVGVAVKDLIKGLDHFVFIAVRRVLVPPLDGHLMRFYDADAPEAAPEMMSTPQQTAQAAPQDEPLSAAAPSAAPSASADHRPSVSSPLVPPPSEAASAPAAAD